MNARLRQSVSMLSLETPPQRRTSPTTALLRHALEQCERNSMPAYLDSSNPRNIRLYQRLGFEIVATIQTGTSRTVVPMLRRRR